MLALNLILVQQSHDLTFYGFYELFLEVHHTRRSGHSQDLTPICTPDATARLEANCTPCVHREEAIGWIEARPWNGRPTLGPQRVELSLGEALPVQPRLADYRSNRRRAVQTFTSDLEQALTQLMRARLD